MLTKNWIDKERLIDMGNYQEFINMDKTHLNKTKVKNFNAAVRRWRKETDGHLKRYEKSDYIRGLK